jgi:hypothetical protein
MRAGFSFSYPPISLLLGQPLSIKRAMQERYNYNTSYNHYYNINLKPKVKTIAPKILAHTQMHNKY